MHSKAKVHRLFPNVTQRDIQGSLQSKLLLTDTGDDSKLVHRRKRPKVDTLFSSLFSEASERRVLLSAESKILASTFGRIRLYRLIIRKFSTFPISGMILPFSDRAQKSTYLL